MQRTQLVLLVPPLARAVARVQDALAHTQVLRGDFQQLVIIDELEALFQRHRMDGNQAHCVFGSGSVAHVGDVLLFADVDDKVIRAGVLTDDHALVNVLLRADEQRAAFLRVEQRIGGGNAAFVRHQRADAAVRNIATADMMPSPRVSVMNSLR